MGKWSKCFQVPEFLEYTRGYMLPERIKGQLVQNLRIEKGSHVLEVGCGTAYLSRLLKSAEPSIGITAIDIDDGFIEAAKRLAENEGINDIDFYVGDAEALPFRDDMFDCVVSHTLFTSVNNPDTALEEMRRVVKMGGRISSLTSMYVPPPIAESGHYPPECTWYGRYETLFAKVWNLYESLNPISNYVNGMSSSQIPNLFVAHGLTEISLFPIGIAFSFSDSSVSRVEKEKYAILSFEAEKTKLQYFLTLKGREKYLSDEEAEEYVDLIQRKRDFLLSSIGENSIFEWTGSAEIMVTGKK